MALPHPAPLPQCPAIRRWLLASNAPEQMATPLTGDSVSSLQQSRFARVLAAKKVEGRTGFRRTPQ